MLPTLDVGSLTALGGPSEGEHCMNRRARLTVLSLLVPALLVPVGGIASAKDHRGGGGDDDLLCWLLEWECGDDGDEDGVVYPAPTGVIEGVAVDSDGKGIDNVAVQALDASTGAPVATALTYASARRDGPQHGYFYLFVDPGVYDVVLVKRGYDATFLSDVTAKADRHTALGELTLGLRDWPTSTVADVVDPVVTPNEPVLVEVDVDSRKARVTGGQVVVTEGKRVLAKQRLTHADKGTITVNLGRLPRGTHKLTVAYKAVDGLKSSTARTVKVTVAKRVKGRPVSW